MFEVNKFYKHRTAGIEAVYRIIRVEGTTAYITWPAHMAEYCWLNCARYFNLYEEVQEDGSPLPEPEPIVTTEAVVYLAYMKHRRNGTIVPLSATSEEKLGRLISGHNNYGGYDILAKKKIKFNI